MISEGSGQNVFVVSGGTLYTAPIDGTLLHGITRDTIITLARDLGLPVREQHLPREALYTADEVFLTGTAAEVTPVREIDGMKLKAGKDTLGASFQRAYLRAVTGKDESRRGWLTPVNA